MIGWFLSASLFLSFNAAAAEYKMETKHVQGDDVITITEAGNTEFKASYKGGDSEKIHESMNEFIEVTGRPRPLVWTEWSSGQVGVVKVFDLNCEATQQLRLDRKTYGVPTHILDPAGLHVTVMNYDPFSVNKSTPRIVEWLVPLACDQKPKMISKSE